ncbi:MAG: Ig-like domain-containing protein, partial [Acidobacteriota bacterium]
AAGSYTLTAVATDNLLATQTSAPVHITVTNPGGSLPAPWVSQDIGSVGIAGSATYSGSTFTVKGAGADITSGSDSFQFVSQPLSGDGQIVARVVSVTNTDPWAKVGVMIRETKTASSSYAMMTVTSGLGLTFMRGKPTGGGFTRTTLTPGVAPYWVKLVRAGNTFTAYQSTTGASWTLVGSDTIPMAASVFAGLAVTAHNASLLNTTLFDNVSAGGTGNTPPTVSITSPSEGAGYTAPASVTINATASDPGGSVTKVDFYNGSTLLGTDTTSPYSWAWNGVPAGSYTLTAVATDNLLATQTSAPVHITVTNPGGSLPAPWVSQDIGSVGIAGSATYSGSTFTVKGAGADITSGSDSFQFVSQPLSGDGQIVARVVSVTNTDPWAKVGVMIRETKTAGSSYAMMTVTSGLGLTFMRGKPTGGGFTRTALTPGAAPYWVKLVRAGNTFTAYQSTTGASWTLVGSDTIPMAANVFVGLAVTAHNASLLNTTLFDSVAKTP